MVETLTKDVKIPNLIKKFKILNCITIQLIGIIKVEEFSIICVDKGTQFIVILLSSFYA